MLIHVKASSQTRELGGYDNELIPMMVLGTPQGDVPVTHPVADELGIFAYSDPEALSRMGDFLRRNFVERVEMVMLVADEFGLNLGDASPDEAYKVAEQIGCLADAFEAGNPVVREQLGFYVIEAQSRKSVYVARDYRYIPSEGWSWGQVSVLPEGASIPLEIELALNIILDASR